jgi:hypothetical protein
VLISEFSLVLPVSSLTFPSREGRRHSSVVFFSLSICLFCLPSYLIFVCRDGVTNLLMVDLNHGVGVRSCAVSYGRDTQLCDSATLSVFF